MSRQRQAASAQPQSLAHRVVIWQRAFGRHDLPWQRTRDAYRIWVSEIMLQQTQVSTVVPYFERFLAALPTVNTLAQAPLDQVMQLWSGLGYYSRARNLHRCAIRVVQDFGGEFPNDPAVLADLPGIGRSTAAAIAALAFDRPAPILDGNVKRVLARHFGVAGYPGEPAVLRSLWSVAEQQMPGEAAQIVPYTQGMMDLGSSVCTRLRPACGRCPISQTCIAHREATVHLIPSARPRKPLAMRHVVLLLAEAAREVLLVRRPPSGIWGGLWSLPQWPLAEAAFAARQLDADLNEQLNVWLRARGMKAMASATLEPVEHSFTHFKLGILPVRMHIAPIVGQGIVRDDPAVVWLHESDLAGAALPAPVRALLERWTQSTLR